MSLLAPVHGTPYVGGPLPAICGVSESGLQSNWKVNYNAVAAPAVTDDSSKGYSVGSRWYYGTNIYECVSAGVGAAVWSQINAVTLPAGTGTELQYRNGSAFGAVAGSSWDGTKLQITGNIESTNIHTRTLGSTFLGKNQTGQSLNYVTLIGDGCYAANSASVGVGYATYVAAQSTAIGSQARAEGYASIAIGRSATSNVALTCVFGCGDYPINVIHAGKGITHATPTAWTLKGTGGSGTNVVGGTLYIAPGPSTGNATPSAVVIQSTVPGTSGSTSQTLVNLVTFENGQVNVENAYPLRFLAADRTLRATIAVSIGNNYQSFQGRYSHGIYTFDTGARVMLTTGTDLTAPGMPFAIRGNIYASNSEVTDMLGIGVNPNIAVANGLGTSLLFRAKSSTTNDQSQGRVAAFWSDATHAARTGIVSIGTVYNAGPMTEQFQVRGNGVVRALFDATNYADFAVSSAGNLTVTPSGGLASLVGDFAVASTNYHYWGASDTDGSWRMGRSGDNIVIERREAGSYVSSAAAALAVAADINMGENSVYFGSTETTATPTGTEVSLNLGTKNHQTLDTSSASGDLTLSITPPSGPCAGTIIVVQGATARDLTISLTSGTLKWLGSVPSWTYDTNKYRMMAWRWNGTHLLLSATEAA